MAKFNAGLCQMWQGKLAPPYEGANIESVSTPKAIEKAKRWAKTVERREGAWLQVLVEGKSVASLNPDEF
jgi:hypothetical protein